MLTALQEAVRVMCTALQPTRLYPRPPDVPPTGPPAELLSPPAPVMVLLSGGVDATVSWPSCTPRAPSWTLTSEPCCGWRPWPGGDSWSELLQSTKAKLIPAHRQPRMTVQVSK